ncbi:hypothetical protein ACFY72_35565 [Streptomyces globisporus]|uniref:hypothetical protein n=1 Tax=Streptomyces globisporus TaxID=1908 RepID=UPI0036ACA8BA
MSIPSPRTTALELPVAGTAVRYHGSLAEHHEGRFLLFPHYTVYSAADHDDDEDHCESLGERYTLLASGSFNLLNHVRPASFTADEGAWWPEDAVTLTHSGFAFKVSHTLPGGSPWARVVAYYAADGRVLREWWRMSSVDRDLIRTLDERGPRRADQKFYRVPDQRAS